MNLLLKKIQRHNCGLTIAFDDKNGLFHHQWVGALAFADDLCLIFKVEEIEQVEAIINSWCSDLELSISDKSGFFIINENPADANYNLHFNETRIQRVESYKYLGFIITKDLNYCLHLD